jgi:hypothetical protein
MKSVISIFCCFFVAFVGWVSFEEVKPLPQIQTSIWQPTHDGLMEINTMKNERSKEQQRCEIEILKAKEYVNQLKKDTIYYATSE